MRKRPKLPIDEVLLDGAPPSWGETVALLVVDGAPRMDEVVLHHRPSATLVVCDLVFNVHDVEGWFSRLVFRSLGVLGRVKQSLFWRLWLTKDRALAEASLESIWTWDIERVVLSHGRLIEGPDAKARLAGALTWMCAGQARRALTSGDP